MDAKTERTARLSVLESFFKVAAENPEVDFSAPADTEDEYFDAIRDIEPDADKEMNDKGGLFYASW